MTNESETRICVYCGEICEDVTSLAITEHVLNCEMRPELGLVLKNKFLEEMGDNVLNALHDVVEMVAEIEGTATTVWEVYRLVQEGWEIAKNTDPKYLAEGVRKK